MSMFFFSSRRRHTRFDCDWSSDVCSSDLARPAPRLAVQTDSLQLRLELSRARVGLVQQQAVVRVARLTLGSRVGAAGPGRERGVEGKRGDLRGCRINKKKKKQAQYRVTVH